MATKLTPEIMAERWGKLFPDIDFERYREVDLRLVEEALELRNGPQILLSSGKRMRVRGPIGLGPILIHRYDYDLDFVDKIPHALVPGAPLGLKRGERVAAFNNILNWSIDTLNFYPLFVHNDYHSDQGVDVMCPREGDGVLMQVWFNDLRERR